MVNWVLGTANFGTKYGITNANELRIDEIEEIFRACTNFGILRLDTAQGYGKSQSIIGKSVLTKNMVITTKISTGRSSTSEDIINQIDSTLGQLQRKSVQTVLLHSSLDVLLERRDEIRRSMDIAIESGRITDYGLSIYTEAELMTALEAFPRAKTYQVPENILDQRLLDSNTVKAATLAGIKFQVRSIFLQGLLLGQAKQIPKSLEELSIPVHQFQEWCSSESITPLQACVNYAKSLPWASELIFSANSLQQLIQILKCIEKSQNLDLSRVSHLSAMHKNEIDPRNWKTE